MGIVRLPSGIYATRKKVPDRLAEAVAIVTDAPKSKVSWLKRSLGTRDQKQANILGKPILMEFDRILAKAETRLTEKPIRSSLPPQEIKRMCEYYYAQKLAQDDETRLYGSGSEALFRSIAHQISQGDNSTEVETPFDAPWTNPFNGMQLEVKKPDRESCETEELWTLFASPIYVSGERPKAGCGEAAYWLPLLGLFTGARLGELLGPLAADVITDDATGILYFQITENEAQGRMLKTVSSRRIISVHPQLADPAQVLLPAITSSPAVYI